MDIRKNKLPLTMAFLVCFLVITLTFNANSPPVSTSTGTGANGKITIILDAGHGGADGGCVGINGEIEKNINLAVVKNLRQLLEFSGFNVILTRDGDRSVHSEGVTGLRNQKVSDMQNRKAIIDAHPESFFFSVHQNIFTNPALSGGQMFYTNQNSENYKLALTLQGCFAELQPDNKREVKLIDNDLYLFKAAVQPSVLIECGFLSNASDAAKLSDAEYQRKVAFTIYKGITMYLDGANTDVQTGVAYEGDEIKTGLYMQ